MNLIVNGEPLDYTGDPRLPAFLLTQKAEPARVAVLVNDAIVPLAEREAVVLREGDRVELLVFAGGG